MLCYVVLTETIGKLNIYIESIHNAMTSLKKKHKSSIFGAYRLDTVYLSEQGLEDPWKFCEAERGPRAKKKEWEKSAIDRIEACGSC